MTRNDEGKALYDAQRIGAEQITAALNREALNREAKAARPLCQEAQQMAASREHEPSGIVVVWVVWHRLRRHWVEQNGWLISGGRSRRAWWCLTCGERRYGYAPLWMRWREQG